MGIPSEMVKTEKKPFGYIYLATNNATGKVYVGKTEKTIKERWQVHLGDAKALKKEREANPEKKIIGRHLDNSINKYDPDVWDLKQIDIANSKPELSQKEKFYVKEYDSMNPDKGYNMTEGGEGGKGRPEVLENLSKIGKEKWQEKEYIEKQLNERKERAKDPKWLEKMTEINRERAKDPKYQEKMSEIMKKVPKLKSISERIFQFQVFCNIRVHSNTIKIMLHKEEYEPYPSQSSRIHV